MTVEYNHLNLPKKMTFTPGGANNTIELLYDASGNKLRKTIKYGTTTIYTQDYIAGIEYRSGVREAIYHSEGRIFYTSPTTTRYEYTVRDHLGNSRLTFTDKNGNGKIDVLTTSSNEVLQENHYYPFGLNAEQSWINDAAIDTRYQYNGKELNVDLGLNWNDYGARWYDAAVGRFTGVDLMAHLRSWVSSYNFTQNNPINRVDPNGALDSPIYGQDGKFLGVDSEGFTGNVVVMNEYIYSRLTDGGTKTIDHNLTTALVENTSVATNLGDADLSAQAVSNILTHVTLQTEGINFDRLEGRIIHTIDTQNDAEGLSQVNGDRFGNPTNPPINATAMEVTNPDGSINVTTRMLFGQSPMNTVGHIQSTLGIHEYKGHGLLNIGGGADEKKAYMLEYNNKATFNKLSTRQQNLIKQNAGIK